MSSLFPRSFVSYKQPYVHARSLVYPLSASERGSKSSPPEAHPRERERAFFYLSSHRQSRRRFLFIIYLACARTTNVRKTSITLSYLMSHITISDHFVLGKGPLPVRTS